MYQMGIQQGAIGGKLLGAGGGGFMLFFVEPSKRENFIKRFANYICVPFGFEDSGSQIIYYRPDKEMIIN